MYLNGLRGALTLNMPDGTQQTFTAITTELDQAIKAGGISADGKRIDTFLGGYLIGGCPLNVYLGLGWQPGQQQALIDAGRVECVPGYENIGVLPPPTAISVTAPAPAPVFQSPGPSASGGGIRPQQFAPQPYQLPLNIPSTGSVISDAGGYGPVQDAGTPWYIFAGLALGALAIFRR